VPITTIEELLLKMIHSLFTKRKILPVLLFLAFTLSGTVFASAQTTQLGAAESVLEQIAEHLSVLEFEKAIALFDTIPNPERNVSSLRLLEASVLSSAGRHADARRIVEAISSAEPENIEALFVLATIEEVSGRQRQQQAALDRIIRINPNNSQALIGLGNIALQARALRPAASHFHRVLTNEPENVEALIGLSRAFRMNREWEQAEILLNRAVELYPNMLEGRTDRARFYWGRGLLVQALVDMDEAKRIAPRDYWIAIDRGNLLLEMGRRRQALDEFLRAVEINPREHLAYIFTAGLKDEFGDHDGAASHYAILARLRPDYYFGLEGLGLHQMRVGNWAEARDTFMEVYRRAPEEHLYALLAAINWMRAEDITAPRAFLQQVLPRVQRDTLEWHMFRLYIDLTARNFSGESNMVVRLDRERNEELRARMLFYMALYYDVRGNADLANRYFLMVNEMSVRSIPEWRLNEWILAERGLKL